MSDEMASTSGRSDISLDMTLKGSMRIFISHDRKRVSLDVYENQSVCDIKNIVREIFDIGSDEGPASTEMQERKVLSLVYAGSHLDNNWMITDIGITPGSTVKAVLRDEIKPSMFIYTKFNKKTIPLFEKINIRAMKLEDFRGIASRKAGLPVTIFRLVNTDENGIEMFDGHTLDDYDVELGQTIHLQTWDGWNDILNLSINGFTGQVMSNLDNNDIIARYQMKVSLYIAAHFGNVDLAVSMLRQGIRGDEPVGEHPTRQWCRSSIRHIDSLKSPVHEAAEAGQLGVLRSFIHSNVCNVLAKDGNDLTPLNLCLRKKQKACASFLLTKQWNKINYSKKSSIPLSIFCKMKRWSDKSKEKVLIIHGQWKSSIKNPRRHMPTGALVGYGVQLDGYSKSKMNSKSAALVKIEQDEEERRNRPVFDLSEEGDHSPSPNLLLRSMNSVSTLKFPRVNRTVRLTSKASYDNTSKAETDDEGESSSREPLTKIQRPRSRSESRTDTNVKLPAIKERYSHKNYSISHQNLTTGNKNEPEFQGVKNQSKATSLYLKTPATRKSNKENETEDSIAEEYNEKPKKRESPKRKSKSHVHKYDTPKDVQSPRTLIRSHSEDLTRSTLALYEKYRGLKSREYAMRCLDVAGTFKERPWLQQVHQAMIIARQGVKKIVARQPNIFHNASVASSIESDTDEVSSVKSLVEDDVFKPMATV